MIKFQSTCREILLLPGNWCLLVLLIITFPVCFMFYGDKWEQKINTKAYTMLRQLCSCSFLAVGYLLLFKVAFFFSVSLSQVIIVVIINNFQKPLPKQRKLSFCGRAPLPLHAGGPSFNTWHLQVRQRKAMVMKLWRTTTSQCWQYWQAAQSYAGSHLMIQQCQNSYHCIPWNQRDRQRTIGSFTPYWASAVPMYLLESALTILTI